MYKTHLFLCTRIVSLYSVDIQDAQLSKIRFYSTNPLIQFTTLKFHSHDLSLRLLYEYFFQDTFPTKQFLILSRYVTNYQLLEKLSIIIIHSSAMNIVFVCLSE